MRKSALAYVRISRDPKAEREGVERQRQDVRRLAVDLGADLGTIFEDNDLSAWSKRKSATEWGKALRAIEQDKPDYLLVFKMDRLGRRLSDIEGLDDLCRSTGTVVVSTVEGNVFENTAWPILAAVAKMESKNTSVRVRRAQETRRARGLSVNGGTRPFGFMSDRVTILPDEAAIIRDLYQKVLNGDSILACVEWLNSQKIPTVQNGLWRINRVSTILHNPRYCGLLTRKGVIVGEGSFDAIVTEDIWNQAQHALARNDQGKRRSTLLGGLAHCGHCNARMDSNGVGAYRCSNNQKGCVSRDQFRLDSYVTEFMLTRFSDDIVKDDKALADTEVKSLRKQLVLLSAQVEELSTFLFEGQIRETRVLRDKLAALQRQEDRLKATLARAQIAVRTASTDSAAGRNWSSWSIEERRRWMSQRIETIIVKPSGRGCRILDPSSVTIHLVERV
jgi:site-specific DNA recombinase